MGRQHSLQAQRVTQWLTLAIILATGAPVRGENLLGQMASDRASHSCCHSTVEQRGPSPRAVLTNASVRTTLPALANATWMDRKEAYQLEDASSQLRLIMFETDSNSDATTVRLSFHRHAHIYQQQNVSWSFDKQYAYVRTDHSRCLVAGWKNYSTGAYGYVVIDAANDPKSPAFHWTNNSGDSYSADEGGWQATNWPVIPEMTETAKDFFVGIQMGRSANHNDATHIVFSPQYLPAKSE